MFDTHLHCEFSTDGNMTLPEAMAAARQQHIGIILTEHWDYEFPGHPDWFRFDRDEYFRRNGPYRTEGELEGNPEGEAGRPPVLLGLELGMQPHLAAAEDAVPEGYAFDYVIGSIHMLDRRDLYEKATYDRLYLPVLALRGQGLPARRAAGSVGRTVPHPRRQGQVP